MKWAVKQRQDFITLQLHQFGMIGRRHLTEEFGISRPQASNDLGDYQRIYPDALRYNRSTKIYMANKLPPLPPPVVEAEARLMVLLPLVRLAVDRLHPVHDSGLIERLKRCINT